MWRLWTTGSMGDIFRDSNDIPLHYTGCRSHQHQHQNRHLCWTISQCLWLCSIPPEWRVWAGRTGWRVQLCQPGLLPRLVRDLSTGTPGEPWRIRMLCSGWGSENACQLNAKLLVQKMKDSYTNNVLLLLSFLITLQVKLRILTVSWHHRPPITGIVLYMISIFWNINQICR